MLALLTRTSSPPRSRAAEVRASRCLGSATSPARAAVAVRAESSRAAAARESAPRASITRLQPRSARARASARPRPREAPVISATGIDAPPAVADEELIVRLTCFYRQASGPAGASPTIGAGSEGAVTGRVGLIAAGRRRLNPDQVLLARTRAEGRSTEAGDHAPPAAITDRRCTLEGLVGLVRSALLTGLGEALGLGVAAGGSCHRGNPPEVLVTRQ